ncbi:MAG TPA: hypothetical protein VHZ51_30835 [Ktedonobacteraceae bacterium]|jgi:hypothetical protein|nr:hypothetical protein [Ktedonobacteraceae bacterium]
MASEFDVTYYTSSNLEEELAISHFLQGYYRESEEKYMSKPGAKKTARQNQKRKQKELRAKHRQTIQNQAAIPPPFPAELVGVPATAANWVGQKLAGLLRTRKSCYAHSSYGIPPISFSG